MGHHHSHHSTNTNGKKLLWVTLFNFLITLVQIVGGIVSNSLSLISDAIHNFGDASAIFIAFLAERYGNKPANSRKTFGYKRIEILAALFNSSVLIAICIYLIFEAYQRFLTPEAIGGKIMLITASFGLLANLISVIVLHNDKEHSLNIKAAYLHLLGDTLSSVAVIAGGIAIWLYQWYWLDPLITVFVSLFIIYHTWNTVKSTIDILMQATPYEIDILQIKSEIECIENVKDVHHIHVWQLADNSRYMEAHVELDKNLAMNEMMKVKRQIETLLNERFNIEHTTLQMEFCCESDASAQNNCFSTASK